MNENSKMLLLGVGGAGSAAARKIAASFPDTVAYHTIDTDATTGANDPGFILIGGERLSGRGTGGNIGNARLAAEESLERLDETLENVRLAVIVTSLGGGTGGGATLEIARHLKRNGISSVVFATEPFAFEGPDRAKNAQNVASIIEEESSASFFMPLDTIAGDEDNMAVALDKAVESLAAAVTLFWRLTETPGYIKLDAERLRLLFSQAGRGRFATFTASGEDRAAEISAAIESSTLLASGRTRAKVRTILCGILAGDDLRLSEIGKIADTIRSSFGDQCTFELATVNDDATFAGRISVVAMLLEGNSETGADGVGGSAISSIKRKPKTGGVLSHGPQGRGRFNNSEPTVHNGEDLDIPTFIRRNISLDF